MSRGSGCAPDFEQAVRCIGGLRSEYLVMTIPFASLWIDRQCLLVGSVFLPRRWRTSIRADQVEELKVVRMRGWGSGLGVLRPGHALNGLIFSSVNPQDALQAARDQDWPMADETLTVGEFRNAALGYGQRR